MMKIKSMKKPMAKIFLICFALTSLLPLTASAAGSGKEPQKPYEKVAAQSGSWYAEQLAYDQKTNLVVGYTGGYDQRGMSVIELEIREKILLTGIYLPVAGKVDGGLTLRLTDAKGNVFQGFSLEKQKAADLKATNLKTPDQKKENTPDVFADNTVCIFTPSSAITLAKGRYTLALEGADGFTDAYLVKGMRYDAYEKYRQALIAWEMKNNPSQGTEKEKKPGESFGRETLAADNGAAYTYGQYAASHPPVFSLDGDYQIDEIIVSTFNDGQGAPPGKISVRDEKGKTLYSGQSYGVSIENIANGAWKIAPALLLPVGNYTIALSQPEVLSHDQDGEPLFYVKASLPVQLREDFTGTYQINLEALQTSTLKGKTEEKTSSFSLQDFELTVLDKEGEIELIGRYEGLPFSQRCEIIEETAERIVAGFDFAADLSKLPYKAKIAANATVTLTRSGDGAVSLDLEGDAVYDRIASVEKGADHNTYSLKATGNRTQRELPPFVMTALGKSGGAGNIPGPDNAAQAAAGILFPPLAGVVVSVVQEMLKPKAPAHNAVHDKSWYKKKYPDLNDEQLAMVMLADAMGGTDNPDEGDAVSVGDNERGNGSRSSSGESYSGEGYETDESYESDEFSEAETGSGWETEPELQPVGDIEKPEIQSGSEPEMQQSETAQEPETLVLQTSANGAETLYVKDPVTGEWVDPETNSVLDMEKYGQALERMKQDQQWNNAEFGKISAGESGQDKILRVNMEEIRRQEAQENYENMLKRKYGTDDLSEIKSVDDQGNISGIIRERQQRAAEWADTWRRSDKILGVAEVGAVAVGTAADMGIDGLAVITPGGTKIRAGYKVLKSVAGTMADAHAKGKEALNWGNVTEGVIKGGADAALDYIPGSGAKTLIFKAGVTTLGESTGSAAGAALRGEDAGKAFSDGLKSGAYKAAVGAVTDKMAGDMPNPVITRGSFKAVPNLKNVIVSRAGGVKIGAALTDEYGVKPVVLGN